VRMQSLSAGASMRELGDTHLVVERRSRAASVEWCHFRCRASSGALRQADYVAVLIGRETYLCRSCAKAWPEIYARALAGFPDDVEARLAA
jgi:hypothetical protein